MTNIVTLVDLETEWRTITYKPKPLATRTADANCETYWKSVYGPNTTVTVREDIDKPERENFMANLRRDIPILVTPDPDHEDSYVEPLAAMHTEFFESLSEIIWRRYPFGKRGGKKFKLGGQIHSIVAEHYWNSQYWERMTPAQWALQLNRWLEAVEQSAVKTEYDLDTFKRSLVPITPLPL